MCPGPWRRRAAWGRDEPPCGWRAILRRYDQLNIRTIDSLLHLIMRLFALEAGLAPDFQAMFGLGEVFDDLLDPVVAAAEDHDGPERRLLTTALDTILHLEGRAGFLLGAHFRERLGKVLAWRLTNDASCETDPRRIHTELEALYADLARAARAVPPLLDGLKANANFLKLLDKCAALAPGATLPSATFATKASGDDCLNAGSRGRGGAALDAAYAALRAAYAACADQGPILRGARDMAALVALADLMLAVLDELQATRNVLPSARCETLAATMLADCGAPDAFCRLGARLRHMLVDEFQDTSRTQWRALSPLAGECLSKGGSVLLVGDVKQAIYGWRGGDAGCRRCARPPELRHGPARACQPPHNWRSRSEIVAFNNPSSRGLNPGNGPTVPPVCSMTTRRRGPLARAMAETFAGCVQTLPPWPRRHGRRHVRLTRVEPEDGNKDALMEAERTHLRAVRDLRARRPGRDGRAGARQPRPPWCRAGLLTGAAGHHRKQPGLGSHPLCALEAWLPSWTIP
jgi:hypothetical protein